MQYIRKDHKTDPETPDENFTITVQELKEDTPVTTQWGKTVISAGNYLCTDHNGNQFGMTWADLQSLYRKVRETATE